MNKGPLTIMISLLLLVMLVSPPIAIAAGRGHGGGGGHGGVVGRGGFGGRGGFRGGRGFVGGHASHRGFHQPFFHGRRPFFNHRFGRGFPFGAFVSPVVYYGWPGYGWPGYGWPYFYGSALPSNQAAYYGDSGYYGDTYSAPAVYPPAPASAAPIVYSVNIYNPAPAAQPVVQPAVYEPPAVSAPPAPPAPQGVVEYEGGRYELRGDGMTTAYRWVWIPDPPSGPPGATSLRAPASGELAPARRGTIYRWIDDQGVLHVTDRWQTVPQRYRGQAKQNLPS
jgi:hypothetical protein